MAASISQTAHVQGMRALKCICVHVAGHAEGLA